LPRPTAASCKGGRGWKPLLRLIMLSIETDSRRPRGYGAALPGRGLLAVLLYTLLSLTARSAADGSRDIGDVPMLDPVVVTATRTKQLLSDTAADVTVLTRDDIQQSSAQTVDDFLRQIPGFSLFRGSSSLVAHPTTQGVSLRGIGASGASRTLVLLDGDEDGLRRKTGHFYFGETRTSVLCADKIELVAMLR